MKGGAGGYDFFLSSTLLLAPLLLPHRRGHPGCAARRGPQPPPPAACHRLPPLRVTANVPAPSPPAHLRHRRCDTTTATDAALSPLLPRYRHHHRVTAIAVLLSPDPQASPDVRPAATSHWRPATGTRPCLLHRRVTQAVGYAGFAMACPPVGTIST